MKIKDTLIQKGINNLKNIYKMYRIVPYSEGEYNIRPKFRGVNPLILINGIYRKLSELDENFKLEFNKTKKWCQEGYGINILDEYKIIEKNDHNNI